MKTTIPTITSFEGIALEATIRPVTEDLDGIARRLPCRFRRDRPGNPIINRPLFRELSGQGGRWFWVVFLDVVIGASGQAGAAAGGSGWRFLRLSPASSMR